MTARSDVHPSDSDLQGFTQGKLNDLAVRSLIDHLEECPDCRKRAAELPDGTLNVRGGSSRKSGPPTPGSPSVPGAALPTPVPRPSLPVDAPAAPAPKLLLGIPPELAGHTGYEILKELGRGGMGVVYVARNLLMDRLEVLKVMNQALVGKQDAVERFVQEIRSAARLNHPNVATAYTTHLLGDLLVLAMEYVEGDDLGKVVKAKGPLPVPFSCFCVREAALGLQRGHELGLVHRDIKPGNLILSRQGKRSTVKIVDFGLAKAKAEVPVDHGLTPTNQMMGTLGYTAPEQLRDARSADTRADIYSLGCTLYFLLAGGVPFKGSSAYEVFLAQEAAEVEPLRKLRPEVPEALAAVVAKMMAKSAADRFAEPVEVARALLPFLKPVAPSAPGKDVIRLTPSVLDPTFMGARDVPEARRISPDAPDSKTQRFTADEPPRAEGPSASQASRRGRKPRPSGRRKQGDGRWWLIGLVIGVAVLAGTTTLIAVTLVRDRSQPQGVRPQDEQPQAEQPPVERQPGELPRGETLVLDNVPPDAEVEIEGQPTKKTRNGRVVTVSGVRPGPHRVLVFRGSQVVWSKDFLFAPHSEPVRIVMDPPQSVPPPPTPDPSRPNRPPPTGGPPLRPQPGGPRPFEPPFRPPPPKGGPPRPGQTGPGGAG
jgi:serine/threonine protein kinase